MAVKDDQQAYQVAQWLNQNKSHPRYQEMRSALATYIDSRPKQTEEEAAANSTAFGQRVRAASEPAAPTRRAPNVNIDYLPTNEDLERSGELPSLLPNPKARPPKDSSDIGRRILGVTEPMRGAVIAGADMAGAAATGGLGMVMGGWAGLLQPFNPLSDASQADTVRGVADAIGTEPKSRGGRAVAEGLAGPAEKLDQGIKDVSGFVAGGNPELATTFYTALNAPIQIAGGRYLPTRLAQAARLRQIKSQFLERGIRIGNPDMDNQIAQTVRRESGDVPRARGEAIGNDLLPSLRAQHTADASGIAQTQQRIDATAGKVNIQGAGDTRLRLQGLLDKAIPADVLQSAPIQEALKELDRLVGFEDTGNRTVKPVPVGAAMGRAVYENRPDTSAHWRPYQDLMQASDRIGSRIGSGNSPSTQALKLIKSAYDDMLDSRIRQGFVQGDPELAGNRALLGRLQKRYQERFAPGTEVLRLATDLKASPEDFRKYIFGLSNTGMKTEAAQVIKELKTIFGEESPELNAVRLEFLSDALEPLRRNKPDLDAFVTHYENVIRKNKTTIDELDPYAGRMLDDIYKAAQASQRVGGASTFTINPLRFIPRWVIGHQIARKGAMVNASQQILEAMFGRSERTVRRQMLNELAGIDTKAPMFQNGSTRLQAAYSSAVSNEFGEDEE